MPSKGFRYPLLERFWSKVEKTDYCWEWKAAKTPKGYGQFNIDKVVLRAHRVAYELVVGPIPDGLTIDHLCRNPSCVNPDHLEPVTNRENTLRGSNFIAQHAKKTHCPHGHEYTEENTYRKPRGGRECLTCKRRRRRITHGMAHHWAGSGC